MNKHQKRFWLILVLVILSLVVNMPATLNIGNLKLSRPVIDFKIGQSQFQRDLNLKYGLDLSGGTAVTLLAKMDSIPLAERADALSSVKEVIARRVDLFGVSEPAIRTQQSGSQYQVVVELPGLTNPEKALELIGTTAQLKFKVPVYGKPTPSKDATVSATAETVIDFVDSDLTGSDLKKSSVTFDEQTGKPTVSLEFNSEGTDKFAKLTRDFLNKPVAIYLDDQILTAPTVQSEISTGQAVITGDYTIEQAKSLSIQLNAGALRVPVEVVSQTTVAPTLGQDSINMSLRAGLVGLAIVAVFMILYYGWLGVFAVVSLLVYSVITLAIYKLMPITLTLPGIAGLLLSIGMAVDSNILIFERYKEELLAGKPWAAALELGFGRAWDSIRDANLSSLTTAFILFNPLNWSFLVTSGPVRGFALTLVLGIAISLFTGIVVSRTLLRLFYRGPRINRLTN